MRLRHRRPFSLSLTGGEEVDEQIVHALGLIVVDPVARVGQALDAVEVGHVLLVRLASLTRLPSGVVHRP